MQAHWVRSVLENVIRADQHRALQGGTVVVLPESSDTIQGSAEGYSKGKVRVDIVTDNKTTKFIRSARSWAPSRLARYIR